MDIAITGIKPKYSSEKNNAYDTNHFFQVLGESPLKEILELGKGINMQIWEYNGKPYLKFNEQKVCDYSTDLMNESDGSEITQLIIKKYVPYIMDVTFTKHEFENNQEHVKGHAASKINKIC